MSTPLAGPSARPSTSRSSSRASASGAYISSSKPSTSTRRAPGGRASARRAAIPGSAPSSRARCAGVKPCRPPSGTPSGQPSSTRAACGARPVPAGPAGPADAVSYRATSACPFSSTPSGNRTVPFAAATRSTRAPISRANSVSRPWSAADRMSTSATTTYRLRGYRSCSARMVLRTVFPVENSSSTSTSGPRPASSVGSSGSSRCEVAWEWDSSKPPARWTPSTGRRVEWR
jgi:hypothetical protein